jgi:hypothetical protein
VAIQLHVTRIVSFRAISRLRDAPAQYFDSETMSRRTTSAFPSARFRLAAKLPQALQANGSNPTACAAANADWWTHQASNNAQKLGYRNSPKDLRFG